MFWSAAAALHSEISHKGDLLLSAVSPEVSKEVHWCFTTSQPVPLYQGDSQRCKDDGDAVVKRPSAHRDNFGVGADGQLLDGLAHEAGFGQVLQLQHMRKHTHTVRQEACASHR